MQRPFVFLITSAVFDARNGAGDYMRLASFLRASSKALSAL
jgi:hypothetical protein